MMQTPTRLSTMRTMSGSVFRVKFRVQNELKKPFFTINVLYVNYKILKYSQAVKH